MVRCGIDITEINRFKKYLTKENSTHPFLKTVFSQAEIMTNYTLKGIVGFPLGFACKEAAFKAFGISWTNSPIDWKEIELLFHEDIENHEIRFSGFAEEYRNKLNIKKAISSFETTNDYVIFKIILTDD